MIPKDVEKFERHNFVCVCVEVNENDPNISILFEISSYIIYSFYILKKSIFSF